MAKSSALLIFSFLFFESVTCEGDAGFQSVPLSQTFQQSISLSQPFRQFIPLPQPFPVDNSFAFPINQPSQISTVPNFCNVKGSIFVGNKCLLIERTPLSWEESNRYCSQIGFKLLEILGGEEYFSLISYLRANGLLSNSYWIGAGKKYGNIWSWISKGLPIHTTFWAVTFLNGKGVKEPVSQYQISDCGVLSKARSHFIKAEQCSSRNSFICEKSIQTRTDIPSHQVFNPWPVSPYFLQGSEEPQCPEGFTQSTSQENRCYRLFQSDPIDFSTAQTNCETFGVDGNLVTINNVGENNELRDLSGTDIGSVYIGLSRSSSGSLSWTSGESDTYTNWGPGEPSMGGMACGTFDLVTGEWALVSCGDNNGYICETTLT